MNIQTKLISREISEYLWRSGQTVSTAESCTAGNVSSAIAALPGASTYFRGGVVAYSNDLKVKLLGVPSALIEEKGAVSEDVARVMVEGAIEHLNSHYGVAVTGFAGPGGADNAQSSVTIGTIWVAVGNKDRMVCQVLTEDCGRERNVSSAVSLAMHMLRDYLKEEFPEEVEEEEA